MDIKKYKEYNEGKNFDDGWMYNDPRYLGKIVKYEGEYGVIVKNSPHPLENWDGFYVRWDTNKDYDYEQFLMNCKFIDDYNFKYINKDGTLKTDRESIRGPRRGKNKRK